MMIYLMLCNSWFTTLSFALYTQGETNVCKPGRSPMRAVTVMETKPSIISNVQYIHDIVCFPSGMNVYGFEESLQMRYRIWPDAITASGHIQMRYRIWIWRIASADAILDAIFQTSASNYRFQRFNLYVNDQIINSCLVNFDFPL